MLILTLWLLLVIYIFFFHRYLFTKCKRTCLLMYIYLSHECGLQVLLLQYCFSCVHNLTVKSPSKIGFYEINLNHLTLGDSGKGLA